MMNGSQPSGMRAFTIVWLGQVVSLLGTGMTNFALAFWLFEQTGKATTLTLAIFFFIAPSILLSPLAGALVDRSNRKWIIILSDLAAGIATIGLLLLMATDNLQIWHVYVANVVAGTFNSLQFPAFSAAVTMMIPKQHYARASGMMSLADAGSGILAPAFAGALLGLVGLEGIMLIDVITFVAAIGTIVVVAIPQPERTADGMEGKGSLWQESLYGFRYIWRRPSLFGLQLVFFALNFIATFGFVVTVPMILARTGNNELALASVQSIGAVGGVAGGLLLSTWGGPKRKVHGVLMGMFLGSLLGELVLGMGRGIPMWAFGAFMSQFFLPIINGSNQAIWQSKVAPDVQGRVFSVRRLIAQVTAPVATIIAGPLADNVFEPALQPGGAWSGWFGWLVGTGPGAGMGLMLVLAGVFGAAVGLAGYLFRAVRNAEAILPDHVAAAQPSAIEPEKGLEEGVATAD